MAARSCSMVVMVTCRRRLRTCSPGSSSNLRATTSKATSHSSQRPVTRDSYRLRATRHETR